MSFHPNFFLTIFLVKLKLSTAKKSKITAFSRFFSPKKNRQVFWEINVELLDKKWRFRTVWIENLQFIYILHHIVVNFYWQRKMQRSLANEMTHVYVAFSTSSVLTCWQMIYLGVRRLLEAQRDFVCSNSVLEP